MAGAQHAFATSGYRATSVPAIAGEAGVSVGLIYR
ncbi:MAG: TetR family transcriptional regulator, partial [Candidatus Limnocylindria bacterium]